MQLISYIPLVLTVIGTIIPLNALNSKNNLGRTFFTDEQRVKVRFFNIVILSIIIGFGITYFFLAIKINARENFQIKTTEMTSALGWGITFFLISLLLTSPLIKWIDNFIIKTHFKYKVVPSEEIGEVYIIRMYDKDTCICSKNPNAEFSQHNDYILIAMQEIMGKNLLQEKVTKPSRTVLSKFFDL